MQALKKNRLVGLLLIFAAVLLISHDITFSLAQAADDPNGKTLQEKQLKNQVNIKMKKTKDIGEAPLQEDNRSWFSRNKWWVALSVILVGGAAAAFMYEDEQPNDSGEGEYYLEW